MHLKTLPEIRNSLEISLPIPFLIFSGSYCSMLIYVKIGIFIQTEDGSISTFDRSFVISYDMDELGNSFRQVRLYRITKKWILIN